MDKNFKSAVLCGILVSLAVSLMVNLAFYGYPSLGYVLTVPPPLPPPLPPPPSPHCNIHTAKCDPNVITGLNCTVGDDDPCKTYCDYSNGGGKCSNIKNSDDLCYGYGSSCYTYCNYKNKTCVKASEANSGTRCKADGECKARCNLRSFKCDPKGTGILCTTDTDCKGHCSASNLCLPGGMGKECSMKADCKVNCNDSGGTCKDPDPTHSSGCKSGETNIPNTDCSDKNPKQVCCKPK